MAAEAEATREARAKVVAAEGEQKSSKALKEAADIISQSPAALQLRYLQVRIHTYIPMQPMTSKVTHLTPYERYIRAAQALSKAWISC